MLTIEIIVAAIGDDKLTLRRRPGAFRYYEFEYDIPIHHVMRTKPIFYENLDDLDVDTWVREGRKFIAEATEFEVNSRMSSLREDVRYLPRQVYWDFDRYKKVV